ncbi:acid resistance repetitive basic protein Asr [Pectobacterium cacticida]|uniref:Acid resistance repetitive basic protein Asr n=1 Tax=Pectobacterium cacticida TaxID=69221 RepID=A0ABZ2G5N6_9GAMM|nr:acid resistance repetitive basic protein Asr [Pectobacterium cacticida]UYX08429.1 acid resistance repetitive basic protein Asr [Pectobacterium cacticida]
MNKVLVMIAGAALGLSSAAFAADSATNAPAQPSATMTSPAPSKAVHHKRAMNKNAEHQHSAAKKHAKKAKPATQSPAA